MTNRARSSHIGTCLSMADILAVLYGAVLRYDATSPAAPERDRLVLSKGHGAAALYAVLAETGFFPAAMLDGFCQEGSLLAGHATRGVPGVEVSTGSLGHGLSLACGMALAARDDARRIFALLSDGELDEGSTWEALLFAGHQKLAGLCAIVDYNRWQSFGRVADVLSLEPLGAKFDAAGWETRQVDGHDHAALTAALSPAAGQKPVAVIATTVKGKGVSFMEDRLEWHYRSADAQQLAAALREIGEPS